VLNWSDNELLSIPNKEYKTAEIATKGVFCCGERRVARW